MLTVIRFDTASKAFAPVVLLKCLASWSTPLLTHRSTVIKHDSCEPLSYVRVTCPAWVILSRQHGDTQGLDRDTVDGVVGVSVYDA
jgi:hypothetical protein